MDKRAAVEEKLFFSDGTGSCFFFRAAALPFLFFFTLVQTEVPEERREHLDKQAPHEVKRTLIRQQRNVA